MKTHFKFYLFVTAVVLFATIVNAQTPPIAGEWTLIPELSDEFDAGINTDKWYTKDPKWQGRYPSYFEPNNVAIEDGMLKLTCREINDQDTPPELNSWDCPTGYGCTAYTHATAALKSKTKVKYGYFEVEAKATNSKYFNSFWLYDYTSKDATPYVHTEIDVFEVVAESDYLVRTAHVFDNSGVTDPDKKQQQEDGPWWGGNSGYDDWGHAKGYFAEYHVYGLNWTEDSITWYFDGEAKFSAENKYWNQELHVIIDAELEYNVNDTATWPGLPGSEEVVYEIKYIRSWKEGISSVNTNSVHHGEPYIYPNPSSDIFNLSLSSAYIGDINMKVLTIDGRQINELQLQKNETEFEYQIDLSNQALGVYFVQIIADEKSYTKQIILKE